MKLNLGQVNLAKCLHKFLKGQVCKAQDEDRVPDDMKYEMLSWLITDSLADLRICWSCFFSENGLRKAI